MKCYSRDESYCMCESIAHRPLCGRCPKRKKKMKTENLLYPSNYGRYCQRHLLVRRLRHSRHGRLRLRHRSGHLSDGTLLLRLNLVNGRLFRHSRNRTKGNSSLIVISANAVRREIKYQMQRRFKILQPRRRRNLWSLHLYVSWYSTFFSSFSIVRFPPMFNTLFSAFQIRHCHECVEFVWSRL